ncbi:MAG: membrane protein insertase YidC [Candidatus Acidiferrales bacterium]
MSDEQRAGLALVLMVLVLMLWSHFYKPTIPQKPPETNPPAANVQSQQPQQTASVAASPAKKNKAARATKTEQPAAPTKEAASEETITVESPLYRVELSNLGGVVRSWKLEKYRNNENPPKPLELVNAAAAQQLNAWPLSIRLEDPKLDAAANNGLYVVKSSSTDVHAPAEVDFEWSDGHLDVVKQLKFETGYEEQLSVSATLDGNPLSVGVAWRGGFGDQSVPSAAALTEVFYSENSKIQLLTYKKLGVKAHPDEPAEVTGYLDAAGIEDTFFTAAFLSNRPGITLWDWVQQQSVTADGKTSQLPVSEMAAGPQAPGPWDVQLYVGPKELSELGKLQPNLTQLVQFGYMSIIAKPLLWVLKWTYKYVPNYGWDIILLTLAINMALFPLKAKSWRSMKKMQHVAPKQKAIQEKYKKYSMRDPRRKQMQEEIGALYKEHGVNPVGGCLPQLIQFPIWWALYRMLEYSIELRHAPWIGWIHDLSARDPYYILPILMTVAMYYMTKMTPQTMTDPAQQKMMTLMPLAFGLFLFLYSSGLVLYIFTSSLVGIAQQWYLNRTDPLPSRSPFKNKPLKA